MDGIENSDGADKIGGGAAKCARRPKERRRTRQPWLWLRIQTNPLAVILLIHLGWPERVESSSRRTRLWHHHRHSRGDQNTVEIIFGRTWPESWFGDNASSVSWRNRWICIVPIRTYGCNVRDDFGAVDILSKIARDLFAGRVSRWNRSRRRQLSFPQRCHRRRIRRRNGRQDRNCFVAAVRRKTCIKVQYNYRLYFYETNYF